MYFDELLKNEKDFPFPPVLKAYVFPVQFRDCLLEIRTNSAKIAGSITYLYRAILVSDAPRLKRPNIGLSSKTISSPFTFPLPPNLSHQGRRNFKDPIHPRLKSQGIPASYRKANKTRSTPVAYCHFKNNSQYIITRNGKFAYSSKNLSESVARFDWMLMSEIVDHHRHLPIIHASAVVKDGKTVIFAGKSGSGKSSLALLMGLEGWGFVTDDIVLVDKGIYGAPRAFCLAGGLAKDLIGKDVPHIKGIKRGERYVYIDPCKIDMEITSSVLPATHIIFLDKNLKKNRVTYLTPAMTLKRLIDNLFDTSGPFREKLDILIDVTEGVRGAQLTWCDMSLAIKEVKKFVSS